MGILSLDLFIYSLAFSPILLEIQLLSWALSIYWVDMLVFIARKKKQAQK
jgi:hypothetical protein